MNLSFYDDRRCAQSSGSSARFFFIEHGLAARYRDAKFGKDGLGLVLVNLHAGVAAGQMPTVEMLEFMD